MEQLKFWVVFGICVAIFFIIFFAVSIVLITRYRGYEKPKNVRIAFRSEILDVDNELRYVKSSPAEYKVFSDPGKIYVVSVACGNRADKVLTLTKSAIMLSSEEMLHMIIFARYDLIPEIKQELNSWKNSSKRNFNFSVIEPKLPKYEYAKWFIHCTSIQIFLPSILPNIDSVIYANEDAIFLSPPILLWCKLAHFNPNQLAGLSWENRKSGWYSIRSRTRYYGSAGLNSGVVLMNMTRMRQRNWTCDIVDIYQHNKPNLLLGVQDIFNIYFFFNPNYMMLLPCVYNYRTIHCNKQDKCEVDIEEEGANCFPQDAPGIVIVNSNGITFQQDTHYEFIKIFDLMRNYQLDEAPHVDILMIMEAYRYNGLCKSMKKTETNRKTNENWKHVNKT